MITTSKIVLLLVSGIAAVGMVGNAEMGGTPQLPAPKHSEYRIAVHCALGILQVWRSIDLVREYPVETGRGGLGKRRTYDHKTPLGDYEVTWMASRVSPKGHRIVEDKSWCNENSFVYADSGPPLERLSAQCYGGNEATVISISYPNAKDRLKGYTGCCIHIHADRRLDNGALKKSFGCIHMFPDNAKELYEIVDIGTPVKILP